MRVAALYDVHGNLPALQAVLADPRLAEADVVVVGGDVVAGPFPGETLRLLEALGAPARFLRGNADRETAVPGDASGPLADAAAWCRERLSAAELQRVAAWPATAREVVEGLGEALFCHATPDSDTAILTRATPVRDTAALLGDADAAVVVAGHVHVAYDRALPDGRRLVNPGSVGMPYEGGGDARWALLGPGVELLSTPYDVETAAAVIRATGYPRSDDLIEHSLEGGVTADEATAIFEERRQHGA